MMTKITRLVIAFCVLLGAGVSAVNAQKGPTDIDVQHYRINTELVPSEQLLRARAEVRFVPVSETRSVIFELNGSLTIKSIKRTDPVHVVEQASSSISQAPVLARGGSKAQKAKDVKAGNLTAKDNDASGISAGDPQELQFIQDNREAMNVRIDLGSVAQSGQKVTLVFEYEGALDSPQGGPISNARLANVSDQGSYLFYAARWFPFHEYAADRATYDISIKVPKGELVAGYSERPVVATAEVDPKTKQEYSTFNFVCTKPVLPGSFAAGKYISKTVNFGGFSVDVYVKVGDEKLIDHAADVVGKHLTYYSSQFGQYAFGNKLIVAETDDETLETYSGPGILFVSPRALSIGVDERLAREVAYQWWGQAVGLQSFDDTWLSQGMAHFSTLMYMKENGTANQYQQALQAELEKALAFEQSASIRNAPSQLDDQSAAFRSVTFFKGALVLNMLRQLMGDEKFDKMLRDYYNQYNGKNVTLDMFESFASKAAGRNLRFFFGQWVDSTGVPEFRSDYRVLRTRDGFRVPGTIRQDLDTFEMPVEIMLRTEAGNERQTLEMKGTSADFDIMTPSKPIEVIVDPDSKILRSSDELRQGVIVRRGIEHFREQEYVEAEQQFQAAIKLNRSNAWAWYNLGLLYMTQRNWNKALDAFDQSLNGIIRPDWIEVWSYIYRGNCWDMIDQRERALAEYNKAISNGNDYDNAQSVAQEYISVPYGKKKTESPSSENSNQ